MKHLLFLLFALIASNSFATDRERVPAPATQSQTQTANPTAYAPSDSAFYALPAVSLAGGALSSAMCSTSSYTHRSYLWGLFASADGQAKPDMECIGLANRLQAVQAQPQPVVPVTILTQPQQPVQQVACGDVKPKPAGKVAPKKPGACTS